MALMVTSTNTVINQAKTLFSETSLELHMLRDRLETVLEQDGDPELFERFLKRGKKVPCMPSPMMELPTHQNIFP